MKTFLLRRREKKEKKGRGKKGDLTAEHANPFPYSSADLFPIAGGPVPEKKKEGGREKRKERKGKKKTQRRKEENIYMLPTEAPILPSYYRPLLERIKKKGKEKKRKKGS